MLNRPCFLLMDREHAGTLSTRKLVLESAKLNVLSAFSSEEALQMLGRFPHVDGVILDGGFLDMPLPELVRRCKEIAPGAPIIVVGAPGAGDAAGANYYLESFAPVELLKLVTTLRPKEVKAIQQSEEQGQRQERKQQD